MVFIGGRQEEEREDSKASEARFIMAMGPERSRSRHNFSLPCLKWGGQRQLRCVKVDYDGASDGGTHFRPLHRRSQPSSSKYCSDSGGQPRKPPESERKKRSFFEPASFGMSSSRFQPSTASAAEIGRRSAVDCDGDDGIEAVRKKLMLDLQMEMDKMKFAVMRNGSEEIEPPPPRTEAPSVAEARPWNLRNRRAACKEPNANGSVKNQRMDEGNCRFSPAKGAMKSPAGRNDVGGGEYSGVKRPRAKISVSLSKQEIEEDFIAIMGTRPPRRPKKRPRCVQKQLDTLFPGLWLSEITADMYKVNENPEGGKVNDTPTLRFSLWNR